MSNTSVRELLTRAIEAGVQVVDQLNDCPQADPARTAEAFANLSAAVAALPPGILSPSFPENMERWPTMWQSGDRLAARYQVVQLIRRLKRERDAEPTASPIIEVATYQT